MLGKLILIKIKTSAFVHIDINLLKKHRKGGRGTVRGTPRITYIDYIK